MTRIFEALKQAESERGGRQNVVNFPEETEAGRYDGRVCNKMLELYRLIGVHCPGTDGKIIQMMGPGHSVGTSRLTRSFAHVCAEKLGKSVLIVDTDTTSPQFTHFSVKALQTWADALRRKAPPESVFYRVPDSEVRLIKACREYQSAATLLESSLFRKQLHELRTSFDLILLDSAAADVCTDGLELSTVADGTVLVVEAEKTRWQVAQAVKERISIRGGNVIGVLLNGMQFHIPATIYGRL